MKRLSAVALLLVTILLSTGCALVKPKLEHPDVKLVGLRMLPLQGLQQKMALDLVIANPNDRDLSIRGISYKIDIEDINLLSGITDQVPVLKSHQETPVTLEVSADLLQILRLVEHYKRGGIGENVSYNFSAVIDFSAWLPSMHVDKKGMIPLGGKAP